MTPNATGHDHETDGIRETPDGIATLFLLLISVSLQFVFAAFPEYLTNASGPVADVARIALWIGLAAVAVWSFRAVARASRRGSALWPKPLTAMAVSAAMAGAYLGLTALL